MDRKISFIGVGPGDPDLLTIKALKKIESAEKVGNKKLLELLIPSSYSFCFWWPGLFI